MDEIKKAQEERVESFKRELNALLAVYKFRLVPILSITPQGIEPIINVEEISPTPLVLDPQELSK